MKKLYVWIFCAALTTWAAAAGTSQDPAGAVPRISQDELVKVMNSENTIILDVRSLEAYKAGHIPGAIFISYSEVVNRATKELPKDKLIVIYCS